MSALLSHAQVLAAMPAGGLPYNTKTAYIVVRGAVNSGRQESAEILADMFQVRLCLRRCLCKILLLYFAVTLSAKRQ
jgi:hypothetical protein